MPKIKVKYESIKETLMIKDTKISMAESHFGL